MSQACSGHCGNARARMPPRTPARPVKALHRPPARPYRGRMADSTDQKQQTDQAQQTVADVIVSRLREWGVDRIFGYSGDGINGVLDAVRRADDAPAFIQARHEENAAFMAVAH